MELSIINCNNFFKIKGVFNKENLALFEAKFDNIFDRLDVVIISIEHVESMDRHAIKAITKLHEHAVSLSKKLSIVGYGCQTLFKEFKVKIAA